MKGMTEDQATEIKRLFDEGLAYSDIGEAVGKTRNAISGWIARQRALDPDNWPARAVGAAAQDRPRKPRKAERPKPVPEAPKPVPALHARPVAFALRELGQCGFPVEGEPGPDMLVCGGETELGYVYCSWHREVAYDKRVRYR